MVLSLGVTFTSAAILLFSSCKKINASTELGGGLIPPVDNITTFDTTLEVQAFVDSFTKATDSTYLISSDEHFIGHINSDPFFGKTDARLFLQLKPSGYKYTFANRPDSLFIDSVVMVLDYVETYGDTLTPQTVNVYEIDQASVFKADSVYRLRESGIIKGAQLGTRTFAPYTLNDSVKAYQDTTVNQLRIRLNDAFGQRLLNYDTTGTSGAYSSDSSFNTFFKGFALEATAGNAVIGVNLGGANTKLAIYYRYHKNSTTDFDTTVNYFGFSSIGLSASANYVTRDYTGTPFASAVGGTIPDNIVYIQNTPGSFATVKIPGLATLSNRVVHRAELIMEQIYDLSDSIFPTPDLLYLDAYDPTVPDYRTIPFDFAYDASGNTNLAGTFGSVPYRTADPVSNPIKSWHFNMTRYVQNIVTGKESIFDLRLYAPLFTHNLFRPSPTSESTSRIIEVNPAAVKGRVRLGGGNHPTQKMRLRIVYSKI